MSEQAKLPSGDALQVASQIHLNRAWPKNIGELASILDAFAAQQVEAEREEILSSFDEAGGLSDTATEIRDRIRARGGAK